MHACIGVGNHIFWIQKQLALTVVRNTLIPQLPTCPRKELSTNYSTAIVCGGVFKSLDNLKIKEKVVSF